MLVTDRKLFTKLQTITKTSIVLYSAVALDRQLGIQFFLHATIKTGIHVSVYK